MRKSDIDLLTSLGLSKSESIIYLDLIFNGLSSVIDIAKRINFHRPNVYDSLRRLKEIGIIIEMHDGNSKKFKSIEPKKLKLYLKQKEDELEKFIEDLEKIPKKEAVEKEMVAVLKGISIKREILNILDLKKPIFISMNPEFDILDKKFLEKFDKERTKKKVPLKIIFSKMHEKVNDYKKLKYSQIKILDFVAIPNLISILVGDTFYYLQNKNNDLVLIKIKNKDISIEKQAHFEHAWNMK